MTVGFWLVPKESFWVVKTLETPEEKRKVHGAALVELEQIKSVGFAAVGLLMGSKKPFTLTIIPKIQQHVEALGDDAIELNMQRLFTAHVYQKALHDHDATVATFTIQFWLTPALREKVGMDDDFKLFESKEPRMCLLMPSLEDEDNAKEELGEAPPSAEERRAWELSAAFDDATRKFSTQYMAWFACEELYIILEKHVDFAIKFFTAMEYVYNQELKENGPEEATTTY